MYAEHETQSDSAKVYGLVAEFDDPDAILSAAQRTYKEGYRQFEAYTPFPIHGLDEAIGFKKNLVAPIVLAGGVTGAVSGFLMQYIAMVLHYPYLIGGRPPMSWPMFIPITFEMGILFAAFSAVIGMFAMNGLPMPYHPVFNAHRFELATRDAYFLCIEAGDDKYDEGETRTFLEGLGAKQVSVVEQ